MALMVYNGNHLEGLAAGLAEIVAARRPDDPFQKIPLVVHGAGTGRWLRQELAKAANGGFCANLEIMFPGQFFTKWVFEPLVAAGAGDAAGSRRELPLVDKELPFNSDTISLLVMKALAGGLEEGAEFAAVRGYIGNSADSDIRRYQISLRVARLFDRYMTYRPQMLREWEIGEGTATAGSESEAWQRELWRSVTKEEGVAKSYSSYFWRFIEGGWPTAAFEQLRKTGDVYFFGLTTTTPAHLAMLGRLAAMVDIHFFWMNPCRWLWDQAGGPKSSARRVWRESANEAFARCAELAGEMERMILDEAGNPLLGGLGRVGRDLHRMLLDAEWPTVDLFSPNQPRSLLTQIQNDILDGVPAGAGKIPLNEVEDIRPGTVPSLSVHDCFGRLREVEQLREFLIRCFDDDPGLLPRDIIVYASDIEAYAAAIEAVFGGGGEHLPSSIPYSIVDRAPPRENPECAAYLAALKLLDGRFRASEVLAIWSFEAVRANTGISDEEWESLGKLLRGAAVAWGIDEAFRQEAAGFGFRRNSWRFALDRLVLGVAMMPAMEGETSTYFAPAGDNAFEPDFPWLAAERLVAPLDSAESHPRLVGIFNLWMERLFELRGEVRGNRGRVGAEWLDIAERIAEWLLPDPGGGGGALEIRRALGATRQRLRVAGILESQTTWDLTALLLRERLETGGDEGKMFNGRLTFCQLRPMRGFPAKVVAALGMGDGEFPRQDKRLGFDLMDPKTRRLCDRWGKDDERYAFLEAIVSARRKLFISYSGRREGDGQEMPPSILVAELLDYLESRFERAATGGVHGAVVLRHRLHPFSAAYFSDGENLPRSSSRSWLEVAELLESPPREPRACTLAAPASADAAGAAGAAPVERLSVAELAKFLESPCRHYYEKVLGVHRRVEDEETPDDEEPLALDPLAKSNLRGDIHNLLQDTDADGVPAAREKLCRRWEAEGKLPFGIAGRGVFDECWNEVASFLARLAIETKAAGAALPPLTGELAVRGQRGELSIAYNIGNLYAERRLLGVGGGLRARRQLEVLLESAILEVCGANGAAAPRSSRVVSLKEKKPWDAPEVPSPIDYLASLADIYFDGCRRPLCFHLEAAAKATGFDKGKPPPDGFKHEAAAKAWNPGFDQERDFGKPDIYTTSQFGVTYPDNEEFERLARQVFPADD